MDTIKRLGENETVRRISNGTLKSYVDREIDTVDTSAFINLETLNVPKAESVTIGEGVKDTLEVLNAPKAEEVAVDSGELVVNWGKCGGTNDLIVTYKKGDPLWVPKAFLLTGFDTSTTYWGRKANNFSDHSVGYKGASSSISIWKLPQELGKWLYENAEDCPQGYYGGNVGSNNHAYKGIAMYPDVFNSDYGHTDGFGVGIRTKADIDVYEWSTTTPIHPSISSAYTPIKESLEDGAYYLVWQSMPETNNQSAGFANFQLKICFPNVANDDSGTDHLYLRHYNTMTAVPSATNMGKKYTCPPELCIDDTLSNLPNLKVADVHTMDVDVPMFKGCTNLEKATVGGKTPSSISVNWGKCGGSSDVIVTYEKGEPLWIPKAFLAEGFTNSSYTTRRGNKQGTHVGYQGYVESILVYKLPQELGKYLYENAEDCKTRGVYNSSISQSHIYKGIAIYSDTLVSGKNWNKSAEWGIGIRKKEDIDVYEWIDNTVNRLSGISSSSFRSSMEDGAYYLVAQQLSSVPTGYEYSFLNGQLGVFNVEDDDSGTDHIYFRHCAEMESIPNGTSNMGAKYACPFELCAPTLDSSYFEGCDNLKEVTITNPELRVGNAIPKTMTVNWGKCGGSSDVIVEYKEGEGLWIPKAFFEDSGSYVTKRYTDTSSDYSLRVYTLPKDIGAYLYEVAESNTTDVTDYSSSTSDKTNSMAHNYKGIAIYSDNPSEWTDSKNWGVGIRQKWDIGVDGHKYGIPQECQNSASLKSDPDFNEDDYYMVLQDYQSGASAIVTRCSSTTVDNGTPTSDHIYLRKYRSMTDVPSTNNKGEKWTCPSELCTSANLYADETKVPVEEQPLVVNWGKCGGTDDVIVTYNIGDPIWIPRAFLKYRFTGTVMGWDSVVALEPSTVKDVGFVKTFSKEGRTSNGSYIYVFKLPQNLGKYLYDNSEDWNSSFNLGDYNHDSATIAGVNGGNRNYKGIAIYPNTATSWYKSEQWGVGIRKKSDLHVIGYSSASGHPLDETFKSTIQNTTQWAELEDDAYYMVAEGSSSSGGLLDWMSEWSGTDETNPVYFRHYNTMNRPPHWTDNNTRPSYGVIGDATNVGEKYITSVELCRPQKNVYYSKTRKKDSFTVNWGKCGGASDVLVAYKVGDPLYIPKEFLEEGYDESTRLPKDDVLNGNVGYQTWFGYDDHSGSSRNDATQSSTYICVYKLPQELGKWLYDNAEDSIRGTRSYAQGGLAGDALLYHGIAIYPDTVNPNTKWSSSYGWGVGIRKKEDIAMLELNAETYKPTSISGTKNYTNLENFDQWKALEDDAYYLVSQCIVNPGNDRYDRMESYLPLFEKPIYFRRWNTLTTTPTSDISTHGEKYTAPSSLCPPLQITMAEYLKENNPNYDFRER